MSLAQTLSMSALGNAKKAYLIVHLRQSEDADSSKLANKTDGILQAASAVGANSAADAAKAMALEAMSVSVLEVQYNPASLALQANAKSIPFSSLQQNVDSSLPNQNLRPPQVTLSVELLFDAVNREDAFMAEKFQLSVGGVVSAVAGGVTARKGGYTVQPQTNGLLALLLRPNTRMVTFRWADMAFTGVVTEASADYTMFSVSGKPVRSRIRLNITQTVTAKGDVAYWDGAIGQLFKDQNELSGKGAGQVAGNLLNLNAF